MPLSPPLRQSRNAGAHGKGSSAQRVPFAIAALACLLCNSLAQSSAHAGEREDNFQFFREEAARRGGGGGFGSIFGDDEDRPSMRLRVTPRQRGEIGAGGGSQAMCVRTCDGYAFPVANGGDAAMTAYLCKTACPGAETQVYMRHPGADMNTALAANKHRTPYAKLKAADLFKTASVDACTCRPRGAIPTGPVYDDPTLRPGDMIAVGGGKVVAFKGARARPYDENDFVDIKRSKLISQSVLRLVEDRFQVRRGAQRAAKTARERARKPPTAASLQAYAPVTTGGDPKMRVILPAPFDRDAAAQPPLDLSAAAQAPADAPTKD
ncbi:MAG: DUF2865 domain-containing protein [Rhizobiales bacterium]|nr:DUF2865 domain-containing protein [Hyphomicrobiales bacterium]